MKKYLWIAAALLAFAGCTEKEIDPGKDKPGEDEPTEVVDEIELSLTEHRFKVDGGSIPVTVTSSGDWTLTPDVEEGYDWIQANMEEGEDGDEVVFKAQANTTLEEKTASFTFTVGEETATFTAHLDPMVLPSIELKSEASLKYDYNAHESQEIIVTAKGIDYQAFKFSVSDEAKEWITYKVNRPATDLDEGASIMFEVKALEGLDDRSAEIEISAEGTLEPVKVSVLQEAKHVLSLGIEPFYVAKMEGETLEVPVTTNVEYKVEITSEEGSTDWIPRGEKKDGKEVFNIAALSSGKRAAKVTFTQTDAAEGETALVAEFTVTQQASIISQAARMNGNRLYPMWNGNPLNKCSNFTLEMMFKADDFNNTVSTLLGIEGQFLVRFGDTNAKNKIQIASSSKNPLNLDTVIEPGKWYHLAVTFTPNGADGYCLVYLNGEVINKKYSWGAYNAAISGVKEVNLSPAHSNEPDGNRCFWIGYSYEQNRDFHGLITEVRIWNKTLKGTEIKAENHFYRVDPKSEGLVAYWKFDGYSGNTIEDATGNGHKLCGETNVTKIGSVVYGTPGISYQQVSLPEK